MQETRCFLIQQLPQRMCFQNLSDWGRSLPPPASWRGIGAPPVLGRPPWLRSQSAEVQPKCKPRGRGSRGRRAQRGKRMTMPQHLNIERKYRSQLNLRQWVHSPDTDKMQADKSIGRTRQRPHGGGGGSIFFLTMLCQSCYCTKEHRHIAEEKTRRKLA